MNCLSLKERPEETLGGSRNIQNLDVVLASPLKISHIIHFKHAQIILHQLSLRKVVTKITFLSIILAKH